MISHAHFFAREIIPPTLARASAISLVSSSLNSRFNVFSSRSASVPLTSPLKRDFVNFFHRPTSVSALEVRGRRSDEVLARDGRKEYWLMYSMAMWMACLSEERGGRSSWVARCRSAIRDCGIFNDAAICEIGRAYGPLHYSAVKVRPRSKRTHRFARDQPIR